MVRVKFKESIRTEYPESGLVVEFVAARGLSTETNPELQPVKYSVYDDALIAELAAADVESIETVDEIPA